MSRPSLDHSPSALTHRGETTVEGLFSSALLEALPDAIVAVDHKGTIVQVNSQALELFGYDRGELVGQKVELLVPESYRGKHQHHRENYAEAPKTRRMGAELD